MGQNFLDQGVVWWVSFEYGRKFWRLIIYEDGYVEKMAYVCGC
jgi:hypothetical protein